jgi:hypothetical protein
MYVIFPNFFESVGFTSSGFSKLEILFTIKSSWAPGLCPTPGYSFQIRPFLTSQVEIPLVLALYMFLMLFLLVCSLVIYIYCIRHLCVCSTVCQIISMWQILCYVFSDLSGGCFVNASLAWNMEHHSSRCALFVFSLVVSEFYSICRIIILCSTY